MLEIYVSKKADPLDLIPMSRTITALAIGTAIVCILNFGPEDFAKFHPAIT
jgi:arabinose-5-phosphate isomerase